MNLWSIIVLNESENVDVERMNESQNTHHFFWNTAWKWKFEKLKQG